MSALLERTFFTSCRRKRERKEKKRKPETRTCGSSPKAEWIRAIRSKTCILIRELSLVKVRAEMTDRDQVSWSRGERHQDRSALCSSFAFASFSSLSFIGPQYFLLHCCLPLLLLYWPWFIKLLLLLLLLILLISCGEQQPQLIRSVTFVGDLWEQETAQCILLLLSSDWRCMEWGWKRALHLGSVCLSSWEDC